MVPASMTCPLSPPSSRTIPSSWVRLRARHRSTLIDDGEENIAGGAGLQNDLSAVRMNGPAVLYRRGGGGFVDAVTCSRTLPVSA